MNGVRIGRRRMVGGCCTLLAAQALPPEFLCRTAVAKPLQRQNDALERVLVVIQLSGGNDGLNTIVPFGDDGYHRARPGIGIGKKDAIRLTDREDLGLHPRMTGFKDLYDRGNLAIVQGVGYPQPNRSHFRSMDIWHTARPESEYSADGWLGRCAERLPPPPGAGVPALSLGSDRLPLALLSRKIAIPAIRDANIYRLEAGPEPRASERRRLFIEAAEAGSADGENLEFLRRTAVEAYRSAERLAQVSRMRANAPYPRTGLGEKLRWVAKMIRGEIGARVYYLTLDGFDTHSRQAAAHAALLGELSDAIAAFMADLRQDSLDEGVMLATFSEFGRRVKENASLGTDHGAASQMFLVSGRLKPGIHGKHPSLDDLDDGDLRHHTDFRQVYATLLEKWLEIPSAEVLGKRFSPLDIV